MGAPANPLAQFMKSQAYQPRVSGALQDPSSFVKQPRMRGQVRAVKPTGFENDYAAYGNLALSFLEGFQKSRQQAAEQDYMDRVANVRAMQNELGSLLNNPDIDQDTKIRAEEMFLNNVRGMYAETTKGADKKNPIVSFLGNILGPPSEGFDQTNPDRFYRDMAMMRQSAVPISTQLENSRNNMLKSVAAMREESPTLFLHDVMKNPEWQKEYAFQIKYGKDPVLDPSFEFAQLPKDPFDQQKALFMQKRQREAIQQQKSNRAGFQAQADFLNTPEGAVAAAQKFNTGLPADGMAIQPTAPPPQMTPAMQTAPPPGLMQPGAPQAGAVPVSLAGRQAGFVYDQTRPAVNFADPNVLPMVKSKMHSYYLPDGRQVAVREVTDAVDPASTPLGMYDESGRPISMEGLSQQRPDIKHGLTDKQIPIRLESFQRQANDYVNGGVVSKERALRDYELYGKALQVGDFEGAEKIEKAALDSYSREAQRIQKIQDTAKQDAKELAQKRQFDSANMTIKGMSNWQNSPSFKTAQLVNTQLAAIRAVEQLLTADPTKDSGIIDALAIDAQAKIGDALTGVREPEFKHFATAVGSPISEYVNAMKSLLTGQPQRLSQQERELLLSTVKASGLSFAKNMLIEAQNHAKQYNHVGADIDWRGLQGVSSVLNQFPGLNKDFVNPQMTPQPTAPPPGAAPVQAPVAQPQRPGLIARPAAGSPFPGGSASGGRPVVKFPARREPPPL